MKRGRLALHRSIVNGFLTPVDIDKLRSEIGLPSDYSFRRIFTIAGVPAKTMRGGHAHKVNSQVLICVSGYINVIIIDYHNGRKVYDSTLLSAGDWLYHPSHQWADLLFLTDDSVLMSLCSHSYDPDDYIHHEDEWVEYMEKL